jgi:hypothetical protein
MAGRSQLPVQIMENQTRFDLNAAVENWRNELAAQPNLASDDRRELETHLRDAIAGFQQRGLNDEESFWLARRRVGQPQQISEEFFKANPAKIWRERVFWMAFAVVAINLWNSSIQGLFFFITNVANKYFSYSFVYVLRSPFAFCCLSTLSIMLVVWFSVFLAQGRATKWRFILQFIFQTRLRFIFVSLTMVFASYFLEALDFWPSQSQFSVSRAAIIEQLCINFFIHSSFPLALVALIAWLMPTQNRKTPKRA